MMEEEEAHHHHHQRHHQNEIDRLRQLGHPATYFGESSQDRKLRLSHLENHQQQQQQQYSNDGGTAAADTVSGNTNDNNNSIHSNNADDKDNNNDDINEDNCTATITTADSSAPVDVDNDQIKATGRKISRAEIELQAEKRRLEKIEKLQLQFRHQQQQQQQQQHNDDDDDADADDGDNTNVDPDAQDLSTSSATGAVVMTPMEKKLFELRSKLNASRKGNVEEMITEERRVSLESAGKKPWAIERMLNTKNTSTSSSSSSNNNNNNKRRKNTHDSNDRAQKRKMEDRHNNQDADDADNDDDEEDDDPFGLTYLTADKSEALAHAKEKKGKRKPPSAGWGNVMTQDHAYNVYKKRSQNSALSQDEYERQKQIQGDAFDGSPHSLEALDYGHDTAPVSEAAKNRLVAEINSQQEARAKFNRRRPYSEKGDITYINERNRVFNRKVARAYDAYTTEIKQNLERGTRL